MTYEKKTAETWKGMTFETGKLCALSDGRIRTHVPEFFCGTQVLFDFPII